MGIGDKIAAVVVLLLALYGCAGLIRQICLWLTRCPGCAFCCRLAVPRRHTALAPLVRCLQSQTVWGDPTGCAHTLLILPDTPLEDGQELEKILSEAPTVLPVTVAQLHDMLQILAQEE